MKLAASVCALMLLSSGIVLPEVLGAFTVGYSSIADYLSALGALDAPYRLLANYSGFLPVALTVIAMITVLWLRLPPTILVRCGLLSLLGVAVGYLGAVAFPCDPGCPASGSARQAMHNLSGLIEYVGGIVGLALLYVGWGATATRAVRLTTLAAIITVTVGVLLMAHPELTRIRGASQRLADYSLFLWFSFVTLSVVRQEPPGTIGDA